MFCYVYGRNPNEDNFSFLVAVFICTSICVNQIETSVMYLIQLFAFILKKMSFKTSKSLAQCQ